MSRSKRASKFAVVMIGTYAAAIAVGVAASPIGSAYVAHRAADYAASARTSTNPNEQIGKYRLALALDPGNSGYRSRLASAYVKQNNLDGAISVLGTTAGERVRKAGYQLSLGRYNEAERSVGTLTSSEAAIIRSKIALEQGSGKKAYQAVIKARSDAERLQLGLSYAAAGINEVADGVLPLMGEGEPKRRLERARSGGVALAQELYRERLYRSAERVLAKAGESGEKDLLLAHIQLELPGKDNRTKLEAAAHGLKQGIEHDPANLKLHELLAEVYRQLEDKDGAVREKQTIDMLRSGKL